MQPSPSLSIGLSTFSLWARPRGHSPSPGLAEPAALLLARELKNTVIVIFTLLREKPLLGEMVFILDGQNQLAHVSNVGAGQVGGVDKIESKSLAVVRNLGLHAGLVLSDAIVRQHQAIVVHVIHGHHALFLHGFHLLPNRRRPLSM